MPASRLHRVEQVGDLERDALERGAGDVRRRRAARDADDRAARVRVPVRRAEAGERRHEVDAAGVGDARGERLDLRRASRIMPSPSRSHCTTAPAMKTLPSSAYSVRPPICHATVVSSCCCDASASVPVFSSRKQPVP